VNEVSIDLSEEQLAWESLSELAETIRDMRPGVSAWIPASSHSTRLEVFGDAPATAIAFDWLAADLMANQWLERRPSRF
jgi:hypothetical protein